MSEGQSANRVAHMDALAIGVMVFLTAAWGLNSVVSKVTVEGLSPPFVSFARAVIAMAAVYGWCIWRGIDVFARDGSLKAGSIVGALFGLEFVLIYAGMDYTSASRANLMTNTMPLFTLVGSHFLLGERATLIKVVGTVLSFIGVGAVFFDKLSLPSPDALYGDLLCIAGGAAWAATALAIRKTGLSALAPEKTLLYQLAGAALVALPFLPFGGPLVKNLSGLVVASLLFQSLFIVAFTYVIWFWLMSVYPLTGLSAFTFLSPVFGVLFSAWMLGDPLTAGLLGGLALIVAGLILVNGGFARGKA